MTHSDTISPCGDDALVVPRVSLIVAVSQNGVIGNQGDLPWRLSSDLRRFKRLTMGHSMIMGRKTYESIGRLLPGRITVIVTRNADYRVQGAIVAHRLEEAFQAVPHDMQRFVIGGGELYRQALPFAQRIYLTRVLAEVAGDTYFPELDRNDWAVVEQETLPASERDDFDHVFEVLERVRFESGVSRR